MAKKSKPAGQAPADRRPDPALPASPLGKARWSMEAGDVRLARKLAREAADSGPEGERDEARRLLARLGPDPRAMLTAAIVLALIAIAAWAAILRHR